MDTSIVVLPVECLSQIISLTSPRDACRLSAVSHLFKSAADSDAVWETFLPSDYKIIISDSASSSLLSTCSSKKDLYFHLCHNPIIINNGTMSFALEKESGKKCYMIGARQLTLKWLCRDKPQWKWESLPESRFHEAVELLMCVWWLDVKGRIDTKILSHGTTYATYFVFKFAKSRNGYKRIPVQLGIYFEGKDYGKRRLTFLDAPINRSQLRQNRGDGWMEIEMSEFFNANGEDGTLVFSVFDFHGFSTEHGLVIEGIELRPKNG